MMGFTLVKITVQCSDAVSQMLPTGAQTVDRPICKLRSHLPVLHRLLLKISGTWLHCEPRSRYLELARAAFASAFQSAGYRTTMLCMICQEGCL